MRQRYTHQHACQSDRPVESRAFRCAVELSRMRCRHPNSCASHSENAYASGNSSPFGVDYQDTSKASVSEKPAEPDLLRRWSKKIAAKRLTRLSARLFRGIEVCVTLKPMAARDPRT